MCPNTSKRSIKKILNFRGDISPFLLHLTKNHVISNVIQRKAKTALKIILDNMEITCGTVPEYREKAISDARFGIDQDELTNDEINQYLSAICFTETPLNETHCLLEIRGRGVNLKPYGVVLLKEWCQKKKVSPVWYINNERGGAERTLKAICDLKNHNDDVAKKILPLIATFGKKVKGEGRYDFIWEREWRYPFIHCPLNLEVKGIFMGLCPHKEISYFKKRFPFIDFIDPRRNMKWYAKELIDARQRCKLKYSVV